MMLHMHFKSNLTHLLDILLQNSCENHTETYSNSNILQNIEYGKFILVLI